MINADPNSAPNSQKFFLRSALSAEISDITACRILEFPQVIPLIILATKNSRYDLVSSKTTKQATVPPIHSRSGFLRQILSDRCPSIGAVRNVAKAYTPMLRAIYRSGTW